MAEHIDLGVCYELVIKQKPMETKTYDLTSIVNMVNYEYDPKEISCSLEDVLYCYIISRMESGDCSHQDAVNVSIVKSLIRGFSDMKKGDFHIPG